MENNVFRNGLKVQIMGEQFLSTTRPGKYVRSLVLILKGVRFSRKEISINYSSKYQNQNDDKGIPATMSDTYCKRKTMKIPCRWTLTKLKLSYSFYFSFVCVCVCDTL